MKASLLTCLAVVVLCSCGKSPEPISGSSPSSPGTPTTKALPFIVEQAMLSDMFQNNLKVAKVNVGVSGGSASEWVATSIAIAERVATFGADSIEVSVRRNEVTESQGARFREVAHAYYSPNPSHSVWDGSKKWEVLQADPAHLATQQDVSISDDFDELNQKLLDKGLGIDAADQKAGAAIAKKYHLSKDWRLPTGNSLSVVSRDSINVDATSAGAALLALGNCMHGKIIRTMTTCDSQ